MDSSPLPPLPPAPAPKKASPDALPAMNDSAAKQTDCASNGVAPCKKKSWFAVILAKVDEKNKETYAADVTIDLKIPELGDVRRVTAAGAKPVMIAQLEPGGKGDVLQMNHDTDVYEAVGDFS
jgi:hypothetical protein